MSTGTRHLQHLVAGVRTQYIFALRTTTTSTGSPLAVGHPPTTQLNAMPRGRNCVDPGTGPPPQRHSGSNDTGDWRIGQALQALADLRRDGQIDPFHERVMLSDLLDILGRPPTSSPIASLPCPSCPSGGTPISDRGSRQPVRPSGNSRQPPGSNSKSTGVWGTATGLQSIHVLS